MQLDQVVPFGRSFDEYIRMFALTEADLQKSILSVADGPASFNAEGTAKGYSIQSCDPLYVFGADEIRDRFYAVRDNIISQIENTQDSWVWNYHTSPTQLKAHRTEVTERFCADFQTGKQSGRYTAGSLPKLTYTDNSYDLCLCSHFLFLYAEQFDTAFHIDAISQMLRIAPEVRLFPLLTLAQTYSPHVALVTEYFNQIGYQCIIEKVDYELQPGGNEMMKIVKQTNCLS